MTQKIIGIDFSGAKYPGKKIWISEAKIIKNQLHINRCISASDLFGGNFHRDDIYISIIKYIYKQNNSYIGFDFPFSLAKKQIKEKTWENFVMNFDNKFEDEYAFRNHYRKLNNGKELKRKTDIETKTPFCPYNLRLYRQTYFGINKIICPIIKDKLATVLPMQNNINSTIKIVEICPASTLKLHNIYLVYKGKDKFHLNNRKNILDYFTNKYSINIHSKKLKGQLLNDPEGDALDSLIALIATFNSMQITNHREFLNDIHYQIEGLVYL